MAMTTKSELLTMGVGYAGQPFVRVAARNDLSPWPYTLGWGWAGQPFIAFLDGTGSGPRRMLINLC